MMLAVFGRWFWFYKLASGIPVLKKSVVEELVSVEDTLLCDLKENVPRQESLYFCLCFFGICYRWLGSDQGWRTRNTPHRWVSFLVLVPGGLPGTDWSLAWDFSEFLQDSVSGTHGTRSHCLLIQRIFKKKLKIRKLSPGKKKHKLWIPGWVGYNILFLRHSDMILT